MRCRALVLLPVLSALSGAACAQSDEADLALAYGDGPVISIATGTRQSLRRAPAVATVFTRDDIVASGATDLTDLLNRVPGLNIARSFYFFDPKFEFRGLSTSFSAHTLVMVNGVRHHANFHSGAEDVWGDMPLDQVERIEIVRGPGSALYGADAVAGVINISTRRLDPEGPPQHESHVELGSHRSRAASARLEHRAGAWSWSLYARRHTSDGPDEVVEADVQTLADRKLGTHASLAPGPLTLPTRGNDAEVSLTHPGLTLQARLKDRWLGGTGPGLADALGRDSFIRNRLRSVSIAYQPQLADATWEVTFKANAVHEALDSHLMLLPPGAAGGQFPEGAFGEPRRTGRQRHLEASLVYSGLNAHRLRAGVGWDDMALLSTGEGRNFNSPYVPGVGYALVPLPQIVQIQGDDRYITPHRRSVKFALLQDEWMLARDWALTAGVRQDRYSDFGSTTNPRLALIWNASLQSSFKLLHGHAFRAPSFQELYNANFIAYGSSTLRPERMRTSELVWDWQASPALQSTLNLFHYRLFDSIRFVPNADPTTGSTATNLAGQTGRGLEWDWRWQVQRHLQLQASLSLQHSRDTLVNQAAGDAPRRLLKLAVDWRPTPEWRVNGFWREVGARPRQSGDGRMAIRNNHLLDLTLHWLPLRSSWQYSAGLRNALNDEARDPSLPNGNIPNDFPLPRRQWTLQATARF